MSLQEGVLLNSRIHIINLRQDDYYVPARIRQRQQRQRHQWKYDYLWIILICGSVLVDRILSFTPCYHSNTFRNNNKRAFVSNKDNPNVRTTGCCCCQPPPILFGYHQKERKDTCAATILNLVPLRTYHDQIKFLSTTTADAYRCCFDQYGRYYPNKRRYDDDDSTATNSIMTNNNKLATADLTDSTTTTTNYYYYYEIGVVEENDLYDISKFIVETFGADAINMSQDMTGLERLMIQPAIEFVNGYSGIVAFAEVLAGLRTRLRFRYRRGVADNDTSQLLLLQRPNLDGLSRNEQITMAASTSIVLAVVAKTAPPPTPANPTTGTDRRITTTTTTTTTTTDPGWNTAGEIIATIELRLQPCDAKIPFTLPWLDRMERTVASWIGLLTNGQDSSSIQQNDLQPYLSNLGVKKEYRGQGLGRALVRCVEDIASTTWNYNRMYLHVDTDNIPAVTLYTNEGYTDVGRRWNPFWSGKAADIAYYVKNISNNNNNK